MAGTVYSHSRLSSFEQCPRKFLFRYIEKRPVETESIEAFVGKRVHEVLERLYRFVGSGRIPSLPKVLKRFATEWDRHFDRERIRITRADSEEEDYRQNGERCLSNYYRRRYPFDSEETLGLEARVAFSLDEAGRYRIQGFVDRFCRAPDGALEIHDFKTGRWVPKQEALDADRQLAFYQLGLEGRYPEAPEVRLVWHYLLRNQMRVSSRTREQLQALRRDTIELIDTIESASEYPPKPGSLCPWCEFRDLCPEGSEIKARASRPPGRGWPRERSAPPPPEPRALPQRDEVETPPGARGQLPLI